MLAKRATRTIAPHPRQTVLWIIAILLAVIATAQLVRRDGSISVPSAVADGPTMIGGKGIYAFTGPLDKTRNGLWMMDVDNRTVWCYEYLPATRKLKLVAARSFEYDRYLTDHENDEPTAQQVRELVEREQQIRSRMQKDAPAARTPAHDDAEDALGTSIPGVFGSESEGTPQEDHDPGH